MSKNIQLISISSTWMNTLPMTLSLLEEYAKLDDNLKDFNFLPYIFHSHNSSIIDYIPDTNIDVAGATLYIWNVNRSLKLLKEIKRRNPKCIILVGGGNAPYYDTDAVKFLQENSFIDFIVHKEGEVPFRQILKYSAGLIDKHQIGSVSFLENGKYVRTQANEFIDLSLSPSPYDNKNFLRTMDEVDKLGLLRGTVWETNRGCPYSCTFCDWGGLTQQKIRSVADERLYSELKFLVQNIDEIFFGDANFGIFKRDVAIAKLIVHLYQTLENPRLKIVHTGNAKNTTDRVFEIGKLFSDYNLQRSGVSLSLQTYTDEALVNVKRSNIKKSAYQELSKRFTEEKIPFYTDMIINLPGETIDSFLDSMEIVLENGVLDIRTFLLEMYPNSEISRDVEKFKLKIKKAKIFKGAYPDEDEYTSQVSETYSMSEKETILIRNLTIFIDVLHQGKYLYFIAKYLKQEHNIRYVDFYRKLFEGATDFINLLTKENEFLKIYNDGLSNQAGSNPPYNINWGNNFRKQQFMWTVVAGNKDVFYSNIKELLLHLNDDRINDLIKFQKDMMIDANYNYQTGKICFYDYNWLDYFYKSAAIDKKNTTLHYYDTHIGTLTEKILLEDPSVFMKYAAGGRSYFTQRQGSYIHQLIKKV